MGLLTRQQSKFIRINGAILNDLAAKTNADDTYLIYMEFWGVDGYITGLKRFENANFVDQISSIHLPVNLIELEDFRATIKYLYQRRRHILHQSRRLALGAFKEKRKYETVVISRPSTPICLSPRVPASEPLNIYYSSPVKAKKTKGYQWTITLAAVSLIFPTAVVYRTASAHHNSVTIAQLFIFINTRLFWLINPPIIFNKELHGDSFYILFFFFIYYLYIILHQQVQNTSCI